jgi:hypothetical protein
MPSSGARATDRQSSAAGAISQQRLDIWYSLRKIAKLVVALPLVSAAALFSVIGLVVWRYEDDLPDHRQLASPSIARPLKWVSVNVNQT